MLNVMGVIDDIHIFITKPPMHTLKIIIVIKLNVVMLLIRQWLITKRGSRMCMLDCLGV